MDASMGPKGRFGTGSLIESRLCLPHHAPEGSPVWGLRWVAVGGSSSAKREKGVEEAQLPRPGSDLDRGFLDLAQTEWRRFPCP